MLFNITDTLEEEFIIAYSALSTFLFFILVIPVLLICALCVLTIAGSNYLDGKVRAFLYNIFAIEICNWVAFAIFFVSFPVPSQENTDESTTCSIIISMFITATLQNISTVTVFTVMVFVYLKFGIPGLKQNVIMSCIGVSWMATLSTSMTPYIFGYRDINHSGFCEVNQDSEWHETYFFAACVQVGICMSIIAVFIFMIMLKTTATIREEGIRKMFIKLIILLVVIAIFRFNINILPFRIPTGENRLYLPEHQVIATSVIFLLRVVVNLPSLVVPIGIVVYYKPSDNAVKQIIIHYLVRQDNEQNPRIGLNMIKKKKGAKKEGIKKEGAKKRLMN